MPLTDEQRARLAELQQQAQLPPGVGGELEAMRRFYDPTPDDEAAIRRVASRRTTS